MDHHRGWIVFSLERLRGFWLQSNIDFLKCTLILCSEVSDKFHSIELRSLIFVSLLGNGLDNEVATIDWMVNVIAFQIRKSQDASECMENGSCKSRH